MILTLVALVGGLALLGFAADQFVIGAGRIAVLRKVSPVVVGIVIVGFGTSTPELLVSVLGTVGGKPEIAVGNIVGSNLANLSLLLGIGAILIDLAVSSATVKREGLITIGAMILFAWVIHDGSINASEGAILLIAMATAALLVIRRPLGTDPLGPETQDLITAQGHRLRTEVLRTTLGLLGTLIAAQDLLWAAVDLADRAGLGEGFIGVTLVAVGTSLPELVTVIQSARRRQTDLIIGNLLGSNLFNALAVGGTVGLIGSGEISEPSLTTIAPLAVIAIGIVAAAAMWTDRAVTRREGIVLVIGYFALIPWLT